MIITIPEPPIYYQFKWWVKFCFNLIVAEGCIRPLLGPNQVALMRNVYEWALGKPEPELGFHTWVPFLFFVSRFSFGIQILLNRGTRLMARKSLRRPLEFFTPGLWSLSSKWKLKYEGLKNSGAIDTKAPYRFHSEVKVMKIGTIFLWFLSFLLPAWHVEQAGGVCDNRHCERECTQRGEK